MGRNNTTHSNTQSMSDLNLQKGRDSEIKTNHFETENPQNKKLFTINYLSPEVKSFLSTKTLT